MTRSRSFTALQAAIVVLHFPPLLIGEDWPQWRGTERDGKTSESSHFDQATPNPWPGTVPLWKASVGIGSSSPICAAGTVYTIGHEQGNEVVRGISAENGKVLWEQSYAAPDYGRHSTGDKNFYQGTSSTPTFDAASGLLFTLGIDGDLSAWDTKSAGKGVWQLNLYEKFGVPQRPQITDKSGSLRDYGYTSSPFVSGKAVVIEVGSPEHGNLIAFDKFSGEPVWKSVNRDPAGHNSGANPITVDGIPCLAVLTSFGLQITRVDHGHAGEEWAAYPWRTDFANNIASPAISGSDVILTSEYNQNRMVRLHVGRDGVREVWEARGAFSQASTPVIDGGHVYWAGTGVTCVDFASGKVRWEGGKFGVSSSVLLTGDQKIIVWGNEGDLALVESANVSPDRFTLLAEKRGIMRDMAWPQVALANGRLLVKDRGGNLVCYALDKSLQTAPAEPKMTPTPAPAAAATLQGFTLADWPPANETTLLSWKAGQGKSQFGGMLARTARIRMESRGDATLTESGAASPGGGSLHLRGAGDALTEALRKSGAFTVELLFTPENLEQEGPARILTLSESAYVRNFTIGQERDTLVLRLRTPQTGENGSQPEVSLGKLTVGQPLALTITYQNGDLRVYRNGIESLRTADVKGDFSNWIPQEFVLGDEWNGERPWRGVIHDFAIGSAALPAGEIVDRFRTCEDKSKD